jgi:hypothetical protein
MAKYFTNHVDGFQRCYRPAGEREFISKERQFGKKREKTVRFGKA